MVKSFIDMGHLFIVSGYIFVVIQYDYKDIHMNGIFIKGSLASLRDDNLFFRYLWEEAAIRRLYLIPQARLLLRIAASSPIVP